MLSANGPRVVRWGEADIPKASPRLVPKASHTSRMIVLSKPALRPLRPAGEAMVAPGGRRREHRHGGRGGQHKRDTAARGDETFEVDWFRPEELSRVDLGSFAEATFERWDGPTVTTARRRYGRRDS